jgi:hypothetical protein
MGREGGGETARRFPGRRETNRREPGRGSAEHGQGDAHGPSGGTGGRRRPRSWGGPTRQRKEGLGVRGWALSGPVWPSRVKVFSFFSFLFLFYIKNIIKYIFK